jgi:hypothetical protein
MRFIKFYEDFSKPETITVKVLPTFYKDTKSSHYTDEIQINKFDETKISTEYLHINERSTKKVYYYASLNEANNNEVLINGYIINDSTKEYKYLTRYEIENLIKVGILESYFYNYCVFEDLDTGKIDNRNWFKII